jgi:hypothetical protein
MFTGSCAERRDRRAHEGRGHRERAMPHYRRSRTSSKFTAARYYQYNVAGDPLQAQIGVRFQF